MSWIDSLVQTPLAAALGWALLHFVWEGAALAILLAVALTVLRSSQARYTAACAALFAMPVVFAITAWQSVPASRELVLVAHSWIGGPLAPPTPAASLPGSSLWQRLTATLPWLAPYWLAGVFLLWARAAVGWFAAQRLRRTGVCTVSTEWQTRFDQICQRMRISRPVLLMESCLAEVPAVVGFFRPVILLPLGLLTGFPAEQVEAFLIHELTHIGRADYLVNLAQTLVEGLLFYHPAVWWISAKVREERENCCDDRVVEATGDAPGYAAALTMLEERRWLAADAALAANGGSLMNRIHRLLGHDRPRAAVGPVIALLLVPACVALAAWKGIPPKAVAPTSPTAPRTNPAQRLVAPVPAQLSQAREPRRREEPRRLLAQVQEPSPQPRLATPYEKWLNEDVAYIITQRERVEFQNLQTDQQREAFITQFWLRRDPTPGTLENEFKVEHYRRIGYANGHFGFGSTGGWRTDRGRIYVEFGPPDELDSHPNGGVDNQNNRINSPFEQWRYRFIQGIGNDVSMEFVDRDRTGNYRMTMDPAGPNGGQRFVPNPQPQ